jgi:hypothetical protein
MAVIGFTQERRPFAANLMPARGRTSQNAATKPFGLCLLGGDDYSHECQLGEPSEPTKYYAWMATALQRPKTVARGENEDQMAVP